MATCKKCGAALEDGQTFCPQCGEPVTQSESQPVVADSEGTSEGTSENTPLTPVENTVENHPVEDHAEEDHVEESNLQQGGKPSQKSKKIGIIVACCAAFLLICGFAAKTYFARDLQMLFMGNNKYMQSMERSTAQALTNQSVEAIDMVMQQLPTPKNNMAEDFKGSIHIDLDNSIKDQMKQQLGSKEALLDKTLNYINSFSMEGSSNLNNQQMQSNVSFKDKSGKLVSVNMFMDKDGKYILQMPEISKIYFAVDNTDVKNPALSVSKINYDSNKLKTSLSALTQPYVDAVQNGKVTVQKNQSLKVDGVSVDNAAKISVTFTADQMAQFTKKMLEAIRKDDYLCTYLVDNYNCFSTSDKMDKEKFQKTLDENIKQFDSNVYANMTLTVSAYVLPDNTQVARSYEFSNSASAAKTTVNLVFQQKQFAANVFENDKERLSAKLLFNTADSGIMQVTVKDADKSEDMGLKIDFSNIKKAKFSNKDTLLGTFNVSLVDPKGAIQKAMTSSMGQSEWAKNLSKSTLKLESSMQGDKLHSNCSLDLKGLATLKVNSEATQKTSNAITMPSIKEGEAIKMESTGTGAAAGQYELQKKFTGDFMTYLSTQLDKDKDLADLLQEVGVNKSIIDYYRMQIK